MYFLKNTNIQKGSRWNGYGSSEMGLQPTHLWGSWVSCPLSGCGSGCISCSRFLSSFSLFNNILLFSIVSTLFSPTFLSPFSLLPHCSFFSFLCYTLFSPDPFNNWPITLNWNILFLIGENNGLMFLAFDLVCQVGKLNSSQFEKDHCLLHSAWDLRSVCLPAVVRGPAEAKVWMRSYKKCYELRPLWVALALTAQVIRSSQVHLLCSNSCGKADIKTKRLF